MAFHPPPIRPHWRVTSVASQFDLRPGRGGEGLCFAPSIEPWDRGEDGRLRRQWLGADGPPRLV